ncbi:MAG: NAD(P)-dependent oxidoreductase [Petrimonas sp.]|nr:NAD(P)-dependent oxidoreductase [Petrimonas sp.]
MKKILITSALHREPLAELFEKFEVFMPRDRDMKRGQVLEMIPDYEVLIPNFSFYTDKEIMDRGVKLEMISNYGVGYNNIDVEYATQKGITVTNIPKTTCEPTAELAFALLLAAGRRIGYYDRKLREHRAIDWSVYGDAGLPVFGKTLGIIGMGRIGQALARRAVASGMSIIYHNRNRLSKDIEERYGAKYVAFDELLRTADYVSLNAPSTPETVKIIGENELSMMKPTAVFINTARGNMVDEKALAKALKEGKIWAAGLDVYENEPKISPELLVLDNVVLAPHAGTRTIEDRHRMAEEMVHNIVGFYEGKYEVSIVNK